MRLAKLNHKGWKNQNPREFKNFGCVAIWVPAVILTGMGIWYFAFRKPEGDEAKNTTERNLQK